MTRILIKNAGITSPERQSPLDMVFVGFGKFLRFTCEESEF